MPTEDIQPDDERAIQMIRSSGLLNENVTLGQLMDLSAELGALGQVDRTTTFIYKHFIYTTTDDKKKKAVEDGGSTEGTVG